MVGAGYNESLFTQPVKPDPKPLQIVYAGKLSNAKGVSWMLRALSMVEAPRWHLHLVGCGSGGEQSDCLRLADKLDKRVTVHGAVSQNQLARILKRLHVFVLPSFHANLPLVVLEALASGCRIVATDVPAVAEIIGDMRYDGIDLVALPRLYEVYKPREEDQMRFETDLKVALQRQIAAAEKHPTIDFFGLSARMPAFSWSGVFKKVQAVYDAATATQRTLLACASPGAWGDND